MNYKIFTKGMRTLVLMLAALVLAAGPSYAVNLMAVEGTWNGIAMWGFADDADSCPVDPVVWDVGPPLTDTDLDLAGNLTINLRNCLSEPVSIVIPGQPATFAPVTTVDGQGRTRITAFTTEAPADGGATTTAYTWTGVKDGTYLYQSGSHPAKQVQMGLYGALTIRNNPADGTPMYPDTSGDVTLLYSEIDPALHSPPAAATPLGYHPRHYLVNGSEGPVSLDSVDGVGDTNQPTVLRFLNAGLDFHVPALNGGHMSLVAEDGNAYPFPKVQYSANLAAGKTIDALWQPATDGTHVIYDRRGNGMVASLSVTVTGDVPVANAGPDQTGVAVGVTVTMDGSGSSTDTLTYSWSFLSVPIGSSAVLSDSTAVGPTFTPDLPGTYLLQLVVNNSANTSAPDTVIISTNLPPVADAGPDQAVSDTELVILDGSGSFDPDTDPFTYSWSFLSVPTGSTAALSDSAAVGPTFTADLAGDYVVQLVVNDGVLNSTPDTVTITASVAVNQPPVAVEDTATVVRNSTAVFINLTDNDSDPDGNLKDVLGNVTNGDPASGTITITTGATTTRGGTVTEVTNGVNYTPKRNFRGTDTFNYIVSDLDGAPSNEVTVRVNVVRP